MSVGILKNIQRTSEIPQCTPAGGYLRRCKNAHNSLLMINVKEISQLYYKWLDSRHSQTNNCRQGEGEVVFHVARSELGVCSRLSGSGWQIITELAHKTYNDTMLQWDVINVRRFEKGPGSWIRPYRTHVVKGERFIFLKCLHCFYTVGGRKVSRCEKRRTRPCVCAGRDASLPRCTRVTPLYSTTSSSKPKWMFCLDWTISEPQHYIRVYPPVLTDVLVHYRLCERFTLFPLTCSQFNTIVPRWCEELYRVTLASSVLKPQPRITKKGFPFYFFLL